MKVIKNIKNFISKFLFKVGDFYWRYWYICSTFVLTVMLIILLINGCNAQSTQDTNVNVSLGLLRDLDYRASKAEELDSVVIYLNYLKIDRDTLIKYLYKDLGSYIQQKKLLTKKIENINEQNRLLFIRNSDLEKESGDCNTKLQIKDEKLLKLTAQNNANKTINIGLGSMLLFIAITVIVTNNN